MMKTDHERILKAFDSFEDDHHYYLVLEWMPFTLDEIIKRKKVFCEREAAAVTYMIAEGLKYLQLNHITHFDIKPSNILIRVDENYMIASLKIADFGLAKQLPNSAVIAGGGFRSG